MKKILSLIFVIGLLFLGVQHGPAIAGHVKNTVYNSPCDAPRTYSIGVVDQRFNISQEELLAVSKDAGALWKNSQGETLFQYDPESKLTINLVYDERQYLNTQIDELNEEVVQQEETLKPEIEVYEQRAAEFKRKSADLNARIDYWNTQGGAPRDEYKKLITEQKALQQEALALENMAYQLNQSTDEYNTQVQQLDQKVDAYNETLEYKPEQGEYIRNGNDEKIVIYFNSSREELLHTLAHEFGHAIGIEHNDNPQSIMYPRTTPVTQLSANDITALAEVCQRRSVFETAGKKLALVFDEVKATATQALSH